MAEDRLGRIAESALELVEEEFKRRDIELGAAVLVVMAKDGEPNMGAASMFNEDTPEEDLLTATLELLLSASRAAAARAGVPFEVLKAGLG